MPSAQKAKGSSWEREVAKDLSQLYGESFLRTPGSGAFTGGSNASRKQFLDESKIRHFKGDIIPGESFPLLNIEAKFYSDFPFHQLLSGACKQLDTWIDQILTSADKDDINILAMKFNRKGSFVAYEQRQTQIKSTNFFCYQNLSTHHGTWIITDYKNFWQTNHSTIAAINAQYLNQMALAKQPQANI